jgi:Flp pilus assembly protein TadD
VLRRLPILVVLCALAMGSWAVVLDSASQNHLLDGVTADPRVGRSEFDRVLRLLQRGDRAAAREQLERLRNRYPDSAGVWELDGMLMLLGGDAAGAEQALRRAATLAPNAGSVQAKLGSSLVMQGKVDEARKTLDAAVALDPDGILAHHVLARLAIADGDVPTAERHYRAAAASLDRMSPVHRELANLLVGTGRAAEARAVLEGVVGATSGPEPLLELARVQAADGDVAAAEKTLERATELHPDETVAWSGRVGTLLEIGSADAARAAAETALEVHPSNPVLEYQLANAHQVLGNRAEAVRRYRALIDGSPARVSALNNLAVLLSDEADSRAEAVTLARQAAREAPGSVEIRDTLGWVLYRNGQGQEGLGLLRGAAAERPEDPEMVCHLGIVSAAVEGADSASADLERCVELGADQSLVQAASALLN